MVKESQLIQGVLEKLPSLNTGFSAVVGLDGYVDKIQRPVQFQKQEGPAFYPTLTEFGQRIVKASHMSTQVELWTQQTKLGGNAPIMANALAALEIRNACLGTFGHPTIHPIFEHMHADCELISVGMPAETNALEFDDGKLILSELTTFSNLDWKRIKELIDLESVRKKVADASLVALVDWCNLPHATSIWKGILEDLITACPQKEWHFFFDLADPSKKGKKEIEQVLSLLREFMPYGEVILGLNENETQVLARLLGHSKRDDALEPLGKCLFERLKIDRLVVHPVERALVFEEKGIYSVEGRLVEKPLVTTGAGDNFNAGFVLGLLHRFPIEECLVLATAASGFYVEHGKSASQQDLCGYLAKWQKELTEVNP